MAAVKSIGQTNAPFAAATKDTVTSTDSPASITVTFTLTGTVAQLQADWATLIAATITATTSAVTWNGGQQ